MTIQELITTLDTFRNEYNTSSDPQVQKLCGFITNTINGLNSYLLFFQNSKTAIENNQQQMSDALVTIEKLVGQTEPDPDNPFEP